MIALGVPQDVRKSPEAIASAVTESPRRNVLRPIGRWTGPPVAVIACLLIDPQILSDGSRCDKRFRRTDPWIRRNLYLRLVTRDADLQTHSVSSRNDPATNLDEVSKGIIAQLQQDGRMPYASIGKAVGLSEAAVRQRVQRLLEHGVMQIVAVTNPLQLGFARQALIGIHAEGDIDPIADALSDMPEVDYVIVTAGSFDLIAEVVCESDDHLLDLLFKRILSIPGVSSTETFVYLRLHKQTYSWGVR